MNATSPRYDRWKAPDEDGAILLWPAVPQLLSDTRENQRLLETCGTARLQNVALQEVRREFRKTLGHHDDQQPLIATGHQTELHHPGVWIKNVLIDALAAKLCGRAIHFAVDTDEPKHLTFRWPGGGVPLLDESSKHERWSGRLRAPSPERLDQARQAISHAAETWDFHPIALEFLEILRKALSGSEYLAGPLIGALHQLDDQLGVRYESRVISPLCESQPYLLFAHHVLSNADAFAADYNACLSEYRRENRIKAAGRPMPDLAVSESDVEVPFWLDDVATGQRVRANVTRQNKSFILHAAGDAFECDPNREGWDAAQCLQRWLKDHNLRLAPRALTLTAVLRLLAADQFIHGIGGGQYDQVLDKLIARHFGLEPPCFAVITATLYFPHAVGQSRVCLPCIVQEGHRLRHSILGEQKTKLVEEIAAAPRHSAQRSSLFSQMHQQLDAVANHPEIRQWENRYAQALARLQSERVIFDRELFYGMQPRDRLEALIQQTRGMVEGR